MTGYGVKKSRKNFTLKSVPIDGVERLMDLYSNNISSILVNPPGRGKRLQCIAFICKLIEMKTKGLLSSYFDRYSLVWFSALLSTAEWSASLEQPCRKVMVTPLPLLSSEDNLMMNCLPVCLSMFMIRQGG